MQNTNTLPLGPVVSNNKSKYLYILAIIILVVLVGYKAQELLKTPTKSPMQALVLKQQNNLEIIGSKLEEQKTLRDQINGLQLKLDGSIKEVKEIESINLQIRNEMINTANTLSLTGSNE